MPGSGPVAFASFTFADTSPGSVLVVPRVLVGRRDGQAWITEFSRGDGPSAVRAVAPVRPSGTLRYADGRLPVHRLPGRGRRGGAPDAGRRAGQGRPRARPAGHRRRPAGRRGSCSAGWSRRYPSCWSYAVDGLVGRHPGAADPPHRRTPCSPGCWPAPAGRTTTGRVRRGRPGRAAARLGRRTATSTRWRWTRWPRRCARCARELRVPGTTGGDRAAQRLAPVHRHRRHPGPGRAGHAAAAGRRGAPDRRRRRHPAGRRGRR